MLSLNNIPQTIAADPHTGMISLGIPGGSATTVAYTLAPTLRVISRANDSVTIYHGALLYALDVGESISATSAKIFSPEAFHHSHDGYPLYSSPSHGPSPATLPPIPPQAHSYSIVNTKPWNIAIDTSTLAFHPGDTSKPLPEEIWSRGAPPSYITGRGCEIEWGLEKGVPAPVPLADAEGKRTCSGPSVDVVLRPYGSLKVHMAELPVVDLGAQ